MRQSLILLFLITLTSSCKNSTKEFQTEELTGEQTNEYIITVLDTIFKTEQEPIRLRDSLMKLYGTESKQAQEQQKIADINHITNEWEIKKLIDAYGWPDKSIVGEQGSLTLCNVIQHSDNEVRLKYLPIMKQAVMEGKLSPRFYGRAEDRIATERGDLQVYGTQIKYYSETLYFDLWPLIDPINVDKRRAVIGLEPIAEFLDRKLNIDWDLELQLKRTNEFLLERK